MASGDTEVLIVGAGAAGIAAGRRLTDAGVACLLAEARPRLGGRAWTVDKESSPIDLGCGWLHSADRNPWTEIAKAQRRSIDKTPPPWTRPSTLIDLSRSEQAEFRQALGAYHERVYEAGRAEIGDRAGAELLEAGNRWNGLIGAISTYLNGAEPACVSARDFSRYDDTGVNWRVTEGYGTVITAHAEGLPIILACAVTRIDHRGKRLSIETNRGAFRADAAIITVPSAILAEERIRFIPALPDKLEAASGLPLGLADKLFLSLADAEEFEKDSRIYGRTDRTATGAYHMRPFGRPMIEAYFGGSLAEELERGGEQAFMEFAAGELTGRLGSGFAKRIKLLALHLWRADPFARGSYSYARPGKADARATLSAPAGKRLFFAGEACSLRDFSTAHGAYLTGVAAAEQVIAARLSR